MSDELLTALENERRYVARELHDGVAQTTLQLGLQAGICNKLLEHNRLDMLATELAQLEARILLASRQVRELIADMRPPQVEPEAGLDEYLQQLIELHLQQGGPPVEYQNGWADASPDLTELRQLALGRVVQEALLNIRKHAQARQVSLTLAVDEQSFVVVVADDGRGFDAAEAAARPTDKGGAGLANLRARVEAIGGTLAIGPNSADQGTVVTVTLAG
ncbi:MAG: ATP-binding protein [Chloroflexota bacterium]